MVNRISNKQLLIKMKNFFFNSDKNLASTSRLKTVCFEETYGRHILRKVATNLCVDKVLDIGFGEGHDLRILREYFPSASLAAVDCKNVHFDKLKDIKVDFHRLNIEIDSLPFSNEKFDFVIANQVLEHVKELFWVNHEVFRVLKPRGFFFIGVPNGLACHNRFLGNFGFHPTCNKSISAHVRIFSKDDVFLFYRFIGKNFCRIRGFYGSQFYPFPKSIARILSTIFPNLATSIFFLIEKIDSYNSEFIYHVQEAGLDTNFYLGPKQIKERNK